MINSKKNLIYIGTILLVFSIVLNTGCTGQANETQQVSTDKGTIKFGLPPWPGVTVKTEVAKVILEEMGYKVETNKLDAGIVYAEMAEGNIDSLLAGWLPVTHKEYWKIHGNNLEQVHINVPETWLGLAVPTYVYDSGVKSLSDLNGKETEFGARIVGIEPGAGIMNSTNEAISAYGLTGYTLKSSSTPAMMAEVDSAILNNEWVVFTIWKPHSAFARFDIKELEDPQGIYGGGDVVYTIVRKGFKEDFPQAYAFFEKFQVTPETQSEWILEYSDKGRDPAEVAKEWVNNNRDQVQEWIS